MSTHLWLLHIHKNQISLLWDYRMGEFMCLSPLNLKENGAYLRPWRMGQQAVYQLRRRLERQGQTKPRDDKTADKAQLLLHAWIAGPFLI